MKALECKSASLVVILLSDMLDKGRAAGTVPLRCNGPRLQRDDAYESRPGVGSVVLVLTVQVRRLELAPMSMLDRHVVMQRLDPQSKSVS